MSEPSVNVPTGTCGKSKVFGKEEKTFWKFPRETKKGSFCSKTPVQVLHITPEEGFFPLNDLTNMQKGTLTTGAQVH